MMHKVTKINRRVLNMVDFMRDKVKSNIVESRKIGNLHIDDEALVQVLNLIDVSITQGFTIGYEDVEKLLVELL